DRCVPEVFEQLLLCRHCAPELNLYTGTVDPVPFERPLGDDIRLIGLDLYLDLEPVRRVLMPGAGDDNRGETARELGIEDGCRDADTLLAAGLPYLVEPRAVEKFAENERHLSRNDTWTIVLHDDPEYVGAGLFDADKNIREHLRFLASIQRIVHGFLDSCNDTACWGVEAEQVFVLLEEFCYTDAALLFCQFVSKNHGPPPRQWLP